MSLRVIQLVDSEDEYKDLQRCQGKQRGVMCTTNAGAVHIVTVPLCDGGSKLNNLVACMVAEDV